MHQLNVLALGPNIFISTLIELKPFLKFNLYDDISNTNKQKIKLNIAIIHKDVLSSNSKIDILTNNNLIKILASNAIEKIGIFDAVLKLPTTLREINSVITLKDKVLFKKSSFFSKPIAKIKKGRLLVIQKCEGEWCRVKTDDFKGWVDRVNLWGGGY